MSQLKTATSRHARVASPVESTRSCEPTSPVAPAATTRRIVSPPAPSVHQLWWDRLPPDQRSHTRASVEADDVEPQMLDILRCNGPVGPYGVRWVGRDATFVPGSFVDFVRACGPISAALLPSPTDPVT